MQLKVSELANCQRALFPDFICYRAGSCLVACCCCGSFAAAIAISIANCELKRRSFARASSFSRLVDLLTGRQLGCSLVIMTPNELLSNERDPNRVVVVGSIPDLVRNWEGPSSTMAIRAAPLACQRATLKHGR